MTELKKLNTYKKGMTVTVRLHGAGVVSEEDRIILSNKRGIIWLDNGAGNKPSGPFINGKMAGVYGFWSEIV